MPGFFSIFILALCTAAQLLPSEPQGCAGGSCYPSTGNLLIGRASYLSATSTCGLQGPERYCIVSHLQESDKCFQCDSRRPYDPSEFRNSHRIENVIYLSDRNKDTTWWQAANGVEEVSIQLNLEAQFHFTHLIMKFKRSDDIICEERYSDIEPSTHGEVIYKVLDPVINVKDPYSPQIQGLLKITNVRVNFSRLHTLGDSLLDRRPEVLQKYYYSLYELLLRGSCFCYGHASHCAPAHTANHSTVAGMIHGRCVCEHNTDGLNCEHCKDFHHDLPWSPAERDNPHTCRECKCNGHSSQCHFDLAVYQATGNVSGGVCDDCLHNTMGLNCELCKPFYYQHPERDIRDQAACISCDCDPAGSLEEGLCDSYTNPAMGMIAGQCRCKPNVGGERCDSCRDGFFGLNSTDPLGCQSCQCDLRGSVSGGSCDPVSGDCSCKRRVSGRHCDQCLPEFWGLSLDMLGCRECACDFGGAYGNRCQTDSGQCDCRPHFGGRQCSEVQPRYFCAPLDFYQYEAEDATGHAPNSPALPGHLKPPAPMSCNELLNNQLLRRRRNTTDLEQREALRQRCPLQQMPDVQSIHIESHPGHRVTWSGSGFARVRDGAGLVFTIDNIPFAMEYDIMLRYEPEARPLSPAEDWEAIISISSLLLSSSQRCGNVLPSEQMYTITLPHQKRYVRTERPFCFEPRNTYAAAVRFQRRGVPQRDVGAYLHADSLLLIPKYTELPGFQGNGRVVEQRREDMLRYMCLDSFMATPTATPAVAPTCSSLTCSISAMMHDGALPCLCDPQGSLTTECAGVRGQCRCKPGVAGRNCDRCTPGTFGFGPQGCTACECHSQGSVSPRCDPVSGQCACHQGASGRQCASCQPGLWGFPSCRPCQCNGHADTCHPHTGTCLDCRDHTAGQLCDRCVNGFYGNPVLGSGDHCHPCLCPGKPGSGHWNADSCLIEPTSDQIICHCREGYAGPRCDRCAPGYFGEPERRGGQCLLCQCSGNIDMQDTESCDPRTGQCLKCLHNTDGPRCAACRPGYRGNAQQQDCNRCACVVEGTLPSHCDGKLCHCQEQTGVCPCRDNVVGLTCDQCAPHHWNLGAERGCEACDCHPQNSAGPHCNMSNGECQCRLGFGGRTCSECERDHWGDPQTECRECRCDPSGSEMLQCNRATGVCRCQEGVAGRSCDRCARGFMGRFPKCERCDPCFHRWDDSVLQLQKDLGHAQHSSGSVQGSRALPTSSHAHVSHARSLWKSLALIQNLINDTDAVRDHEKAYQLLSHSTDDLRAETALIDRRKTGVDGEMSRTAERNRALQQELSQVEREFRDTNATLAQLHPHLHSTGSTGEFDFVRGWYRDSLDAERRCRISVWGPDGPARVSHDTRRRAEGLVNGQLNSRGHGLQLKSLTQRRLHWLHNKVCGGHGKGGTGCRADWRQRLCGRKGCKQIESGYVLQKVNNITDHLSTTSKHLQEAAKELQDVEMLARGVMIRAASSLLTAQEKKDFFRNSNKELRDLLQKIRHFLSDEEADPVAIQLVSQRVLAISLPVDSGTVALAVQEIQHSIANLTLTESNFNNTSQELLQHARDIQAQAGRTWVTANQTQERLDATQTAIRTAEEALEADRQNLNSTRSATATVENSIMRMEDKQRNAAQRLTSVRQEAEPLQRKLNENSVVAQSARARADSTAQATRNLDKELEEAQGRWRKLQEKVGAVGVGTQSLGAVTQRARDIQRQAQDVLKKATECMETMQSLETTFQQNERRMQDQEEELAALERNVTAVRDFIRESILKYSSCT
ncbi:hypothetical protein AAFF_G00145910 [Aldrovandia affinis]|uniref:Laminin subunit beta-2-like n=1 Tax=Aldrovandia affinis TaxID=143900 RepID=A0AAD7T0U4_9TELE|nr:hypothetical protein AAFF_G00145910 [Aldrovandia affinis]